MTPQQATRHSKLLSLHLRHQPEALGLTLQPGSWVPMAVLLAACAAHGHLLSLAELQEIVAGSDKQRFAFDAGPRIRAQQGHSVTVDLELAPATPPAVLCHGTVAEHGGRREGLRKMTRHYVHLSPDEATARRVGSCRGEAVILRIDAAGLPQAGDYTLVVNQLTNFSFVDTCLNDADTGAHQLPALGSTYYFSLSSGALVTSTRFSLSSPWQVRNTSR